MMKGKKDIDYAKVLATNGAMLLFIGVIGLVLFLSLWISDPPLLLRAIPFFVTVFVLFLFINFFITDMCDFLSIIEIDEKSITNKNRYYEEVLLWEEVKDYGIVWGNNGHYSPTRYIYFSGRKFSRKYKSSKRFAENLGVPTYRPKKLRHPVFLSTYIRKKQNQKKEDIVIFFHYTDE